MSLSISECDIRQLHISLMFSVSLLIYFVVVCHSFNPQLMLTRAQKRGRQDQAMDAAICRISLGDLLLIVDRMLQRVVQSGLSGIFISIDSNTIVNFRWLGVAYVFFVLFRGNKKCE